MANNGGAFLPNADYSPTGTWTFSGATNLTGTTTLTSPTLVTPTLTTPTITSPTITGTTTLGTGATITTPTIASPAVTGDASSGVIVSKTVAFVENATMTTSTGTVVIPAGATLHDIVVTSSVLWSKASARFTCGDAQAATGWFTATDLSGTDLLLGERLSAASGQWGGVNGVYLVAATGVFGQATATKAGPYYVTAGSVIGVCTVTPGAGAAGRTFMTVTYSVGQTVAPVIV